MSARLTTITYLGRTMSTAAWAREVGLSEFALKWRLRHGWPALRALTEPPRPARNGGRVPGKCLGLVVCGGVAAPLATIAKRHGMSAGTLTHRARCMPVEEAVALPVRKYVALPPGTRARARANGIPRSTLYRRIDEGWPVDRAASEPPAPRFRNRAKRAA